MLWRDTCRGGAKPGAAAQAARRMTSLSYRVALDLTNNLPAGDWSGPAQVCVRPGESAEVGDHVAKRGLQAA